MRCLYSAISLQKDTRVSMDVESAWDAGYTGKGVLVAVVDDGVHMNHPDLRSNFVSTYFFTYCGQTVLSQMLTCLPHSQGTKVNIQHPSEERGYFRNGVHLFFLIKQTRLRLLVTLLYTFHPLSSKTKLNSLAREGIFFSYVVIQFFSEGNVFVAPQFCNAHPVLHIKVTLLGVCSRAHSEKTKLFFNKCTK